MLSPATRGTRVRRAVYGKTRKEVADQLAVLIARTKAGLPLAVESWTVQRLAEHWLKHVVGPRLRPSTRSSYRETRRLHVVPTLGRINLRALTPTHVRTLLANKAADGLGACSVQIIHSTLSEAMREELIERNVATVVRPPSVEHMELQPGRLKSRAGGRDRRSPHPRAVHGRCRCATEG